jgi:hypothetical protein
MTKDEGRMTNDERRMTDDERRKRAVHQTQPS